MTFATELADGVRRGHEGGPRFLFPLMLIFIIGGLYLLARKRRQGWFAHHGPDADGRRPAPSGPMPPAPPSNTAMTLLQERFPRGEIGEAEFRHRRSVLQGDPTPQGPPAAAASSEVAAPQPPDEVIRTSDPADADVDEPES